MKSALKILLILAIAAFLVVSFVKIGGKEKEIVCQGMDLVVEDSLSLGLISRDEVLGIIRDKKMVFEGKNISDINMGNVERTLCKSPYIDTVLCYPRYLHCMSWLTTARSITWTAGEKTCR